VAPPRPRHQRHELPGDEEGERIVGEHDQRHAGEESRIKRQYPPRRRLMAAIAEREQACARGAEIDHGEEETGERVEAEMRAQPGQADRQGQAFGGSRAEKMRQCCGKRQGGDDDDRAVDHAACRRGANNDDRAHSECELDRSTGKRDYKHHDAGLFSRTPRPPPELTALSVMSSMPSESSAPISFISESTLPRTTPSLASMRWMVGSDSPAASARVR